MNAIFATTWIDLEGIMLNEISQTKIKKYCMISHMESKKKKKAHRKRSDLWLAEGELDEGGQNV